MKISTDNLGTRLFLYLVPMMVIIFAVYSIIDIQSVSSNLTNVLIKQTFEMSNCITYSLRPVMFITGSDDQEAVTHDLTQRLKELKGQFGVSRIDIFNKKGVLVSSTDEASIGEKRELNSAECSSCHEPRDASKSSVPDDFNRVASVESAEGINIYFPIQNQPACYNYDCHVHSPDQKINGVMGIEIPLTPIKKAVSQMRNRLILSSIIMIILLSFLSGIVINKLIKRPMKRLVQSMQVISSANLDAKPALNESGDLNPRQSQIIGPKRNGRFRSELDRVAYAYEIIIDQLNRILSLIQDVSLRITTAGEELSATSEQQARESKIQYQKISRSIEAALKVSEHAQKIKESLKGLHDSAEKTLEGMESMKSVIESSSGKMQNLGEQTKQIGKIADLIHGIAEETNLLALNAAIEAAHAGEHGAGFAVVAEEVRRLADRSTEATREIAMITTSIMDQVEEAISRMDKTTNEVITKADIARETSQLSKEISKSVIEQLSGSKEIEETLKEAKDIIEQFASGAEQTARASDELMNLALELRGLSEQIQPAEKKTGERTPPGSLS